MEGTIVA